MTRAMCTTGGRTRTSRGRAWCEPAGSCGAWAAKLGRGVRGGSSGGSSQGPPRPTDLGMHPLMFRLGGPSFCSLPLLLLLFPSVILVLLDCLLPLP